MVRETRHLWVGNLPENIREERIREHFKRYGRVQSVKLLPRGSKDPASGGCIAGLGGVAAAAEGTLACTIAFMDIKSASKAHTAEHKLEERTLTTEYYEPAAIPSAAAPQTPERTAQPVQPPTAYTPTTNNTRFPNTHGSAEEHPGFSERFYERGAGRVADPEYLRRPGYHETSRGRARDRLYRNGPYPPAIIDRGHRTALGTTWSTYEGTSARYSAGASAEAAYVTTPPIVEPERRTSADVQVIKKKTKSRSGSRTPSPSGSTSSRSPSRSRSRSSSSSSSSSTSRGSSSPTSSPRTRSGRIQSAVNAAPPVHSEDRRPLAICVRNLPARSSDTSLKDGLFHEYKKHGKVTWVKVVGQSSDRYALVCFKKPDDVEKALEVSYDKLFFGCKIEVGPYQGYDVEDNEFRPYEAELDEYHPKATRTLFIGNLEKDVTASDLRKHFDQFGEIIEIDIKKQGAVSSYAFCQYSDIVSVVKAIRKMDGEHLGNNRIKLGFGKSMPTNCVWVDGIAERVDEKYLTLQFERYGQVTQASMDRDRGHALIFFEQVSCAQTAVKEMRGINIRGKKLQVDFASRECQDTFFDHLEKQGGAGCERPVFETTRDATQRERSFDSSTLANTNRYTRSRSGTGSQCTGSSAVPSPGTPGSVTPRGSGSRSRLTRYPDYYEAGVEYPERRFRNYDEFSQGSAASHEDGYDHEYMYNRESPGGHVEPVESRTMQSVVVATDIQAVGAIFVPPDIRHLQKERVHLLEQLDECPSSGDELMSPKKRLKLDLCDSVNINSELVEVNHAGDHRKVIEVRRLSEPGVKYHSRRPSIDGKHCVREVPVERTYLPHAVCKRRKTSGSESDRSRIHHHHDMSGSESLTGSRPGTPLCDERPENLPPSEPRRLPRERNSNDGPLSLPLPRFAAQVLNSPRLNISVAGFKGSKENIVSSPPAIVTSPKVSNPVPPSPVHVPPPASPPPRPPSSSNSSDSDAAPPSPTLEERLRSLDEKYEKWSGSRALSAAGGDALAKLDASASERFRFRHKLLDLDLKELQPSEIVKSVLAKRSVFDEDSKRLENVGEKYEPRDFTFPRTFSSMQQTPTTPVGVNTPPAVPASPLLVLPAATQAKSLPGVKPGTPVVSPRPVTAVPAITAIPAAKGLQYPFPSHPPVATGTGTAAPSPAPVVVTRVAPGNLHSDTRLKLCSSLPLVSADVRTNSKVNLNRSGCPAATVLPPAVSASGGGGVVVVASAVIATIATATLPPKLRCLDNKNNGDSDKIINNNLTNIPINISESAVAASAAVVVSVPSSTACGTVSSVTEVNHVGKTPPRDKSATRKEDRSNSDNNNSKNTHNKSSDKVVSRRDSVSSSPSSAGSYKSDSSKKDRRDKKSDKDNSDSDRTVKSTTSPSSSSSKDNSDIECDRKRADSEYCDKKAEEDKLKAERERVAEKEAAERREREERERLDKEHQEKERIEKERLEKERLEKEKLEKEKVEKERLEKLEREKQEKLEKERTERERLEKERKREKDEKEKRERDERERREKEEQLERERIEKDKQRKEKEERETREREQLEKERQEKELHEKLQREKQEQRKREKDNEKHERRHKEDNHEKKKDEYEKPRQRENHNNTNSTTPDTKNRHRENHIDPMKVERHRDSHDSRKENKDHETRTKEVHENVRNSHDVQRKESHDKPKEHHENARNNSECRREEKHSHNNENSKNRHHTERENESKDRRKETPKEISNSHEKNRHFSTESRDNNKDRHSSTDSRHLSTESDKSRPYNNDHGLNSTPKRIDVNKHKEKNNTSTPASVGCKRRISSQDSSESPDDSKRIKVSLEHKKISDRRDSKDSRDSNKSRSSDTPKQKPHYKSNFTRMLEDKIREEKRNKELSDEKRKDKDRDREHEDRYKLKQAQKAEKIKVKSKSRDSKDTKDCPVVLPVKPCLGKEIMLDKDFLARLDLRANEEEQKHRKENKEKRKQENHEIEERRSSDDAKRIEEHRKKEKYIMGEKKIRDENIIKNFEDKNKNPLQLQIKKEGQLPQQLQPPQQQQQHPQQQHLQQQQLQHPQPQRIRKCTNSSDTSDSDEPKKHSIFDIVDDEPAYISMYDKVKARSCKNMQKQEEEKRQEKLKAKFTQLKQSRAKREEKKRSTSWDEDSDSDHMDSGNRDHDEHEDGVGKQNRRGNKMLITSSSEDELNMSKLRKKSEMYTDSDSDRIRIDKLDRHLDTSDEEHARTKPTLVRKTSKSRITSDTSEDEQMRKRLQHQHDKIKKERYSDSDIDQGFADSDEKPDKHYKKLKEEKLNHYDEDKYIKKERKNSKIHPHSDDDTTRKMLADAVKLEIYGDKESEVRLENKFANSLAMLCDISSEGETIIHNNEKKDIFSLDKSEIRKKHKKKQKRLKNSITSEEAIKLERMTDETENECINRSDEPMEKIKTSEKKKHGSKKDKKRDKIKDEDHIKEKSKKHRKLNKDGSKADLHQLKREGKLEDIFGSFSDDSETGNKDNMLNSHSNKDNNSFFVHLSDKLASNMYATDSDSGQHVDLEKDKLKEEQRKRKEKKRKEKERRLREENENSVDFADLGKVLEDNLKDVINSENLEKVETIQIKTEVEEVVVKTEEIHNNSDVFRFSDGDDESPEVEKKETEKKEIKEKKKKRKKSKEEKQNRHHHHHHDKNQDKIEKIKTPEFIKKEPLLIETIKEEPDIKEEMQSPSLPNILDIPSPPQVKSSPNNTDFSISPINREPLISPIPKTPTSIKSEKKREKFIPGFGSEIDEKVHENAVKSISEFGSPPIVERIEPDEVKSDKSPKQEKSEVAEDKPRVIISQEETEDAVAALLGESFGGGDFDDCYNEEVVVQDDEEMLQAVQSLNSADMEAKPDTPQSEHDLQIDTDTDEGEEIVVRYEQSPRTPDMVDLSRPPKTPDFPTNYYRSDDSTTKTPSVVKQTPEPVPPTKAEDKRNEIEDVRRNIESSLDKIQPASIELPVVSEPSRTVISGSWSVQKQDHREKEPTLEKRKPDIFVSKANEIISIPPKPTVVPLSTQSSILSPTPSVLTSQAYLPPPVIKITEHSTIISPKVEPKLSPVKSYSSMDPKSTPIPPLTTVMPKQRSVPQLPTTMPVRVQHAVISHLPVSVAASKPQNSAISQGLLTTVVTSATVLNRLPITPIMASKAMQPTAMVLPQSKIAVSTIQKLVSSPEVSKHEPSRMVYHSSANMTLPSYSYPTSLTHAQAVPSTFHLPIRTPSPVGLLTHARHVLPPTTYSIPVTTRSVSPLVKEVPKSVIEKTTEHKVFLPSPYSKPAYQPPLHAINTEVKPTTAVIQEAPKLVPIPEVRNSQHSIIQQAPPQKDIMRSLPQSISHPLSQSISHVSMPQLIATKPVTTIPQSTINHSIISHPTITQSLACHPMVSLSHIMPPVVSEPYYTTTSLTMSQAHLLVSKPVVTKPLMPLSNIMLSNRMLPIMASKEVTPTVFLEEPIVPEALVMKLPQENHTPVSTSQESFIDIPRMIKETVPTIPRSSTPSPVIVIPKEISPKVPELLTKKEEPLPVQQEPTISIELKTPKEELKLTESPKPEIQEIKVEPNMIELADKIEPITPVTPVTPFMPKIESNEPISVIKETFEKVKQEDTESIISEPPKEGINTDKDDPLDSKEDSDYWSAKEVNIESVIKKVDALCSADELSEGSEIGKEEWYDEHKTPELEIKTPEKFEKIDNLEIPEIKTDTETESLDTTQEEKELSVRGGRRGGGRLRGRKNNKSERVTTGVTTRRGKSTSTPSRRGGRGGRGRNDKKSKTSESDVYEFHDDSDESKDRPRLILTIKSPAGAGNTPNTPSAVIKEAPKLPEATPREEFVSPAANTRKSRRIQERDGSRNTIDDTIEDVVRNLPIVTRAAAVAAQGVPSPRRSTRQNVMKVPAAVEPRKSPRGTKKKDRRVSETTTDDSSEEKSIKKDDIIKPEINEIVVKEELPKVAPVKLPEKEKPKEIHPMGLKATVLRRVKGDMSEEPMTLIDPVTGLLTQMRECEEGKYIPISNSSVIIGAKAGSLLDTKVELLKTNCISTSTIPTSVVELSTTTVITKPQPLAPVLQKPQSLKAHVLSSQAAKVVVNQPPAPKVAIVQPSQPTFITKPSIPLNQNLNINVSAAPSMDPIVLSPRQMVQKTIMPPQPLKPTQSPMSPNQLGPINNPKQHFLQAVSKQLPVKQVAAVNPKAHLLNAVNQTIMTSAAQTINATMAHKSHMPQPVSLPSPVKQQIIGNVAPIVKPHNLHVPQQILTGAVASPPLKHHLAQQPIVAGASSGRIAIPGSSPMPGISAKGVIDPQKVEVSMAGCVMISHPTVSPQAQARGQVLQAGMPVPAYEASLGEPMAHFPPGTVPLRNPHDLPPHHFMHTHAVYQSYLRSQQDTRIPYHLPRSPMVSGGLEKTKDGQEGEEAPVTSPPLELRRPGSVGLTARPTAVPHSLQSPHDRATDSPQVAQVYMHQARMPHYHTPDRYYESPTEPPPAHRPVTSHTALTGPGSSLGAAGNLIGAISRHTPAEAPTSQRGLQVATPPHASQVPPQADSLLMLLRQYRIMWQGLLALKNDQAAVQMHFVFGNPHVARNSLPCNRDGSTPPLRIAQRMRLEKTQVEGVARKMQMENEHCVLLALPCGRDHMDVLQQSTNLSNGFITYLQQKEAAGIINIAAPGSQHAAYVVHIFPSCDFVKENLARIAPNLLHRVADIAHLLIVIATV